MSTEVLVCIFNEAHTGQAMGHPHMCENWKGNCKRSEIPRLCKIAHIQFQNGMALIHMDAYPGLAHQFICPVRRLNQTQHNNSASFSEPGA